MSNNTINNILLTKEAINTILTFLKYTTPGQHPISLDTYPELYNSIDHIYNTPGLHAWLNTLNIYILKSSDSSYTLSF